MHSGQLYFFWLWYMGIVPSRQTIVSSEPSFRTAAPAPALALCCHGIERLGVGAEREVLRWCRRGMRLMAT